MLVALAYLVLRLAIILYYLPAMRIYDTIQHTCVSGDRDTVRLSLLSVIHVTFSIVLLSTSFFKMMILNHWTDNNKIVFENQCLNCITWFSFILSFFLKICYILFIPLFWERVLLLWAHVHTHMYAHFSKLPCLSNLVTTVLFVSDFDNDCSFILEKVSSCYGHTPSHWPIQWRRDRVANKSDKSLTFVINSSTFPIMWSWCTI